MRVEGVINGPVDRARHPAVCGCGLSREHPLSLITFLYIDRHLAHLRTLRRRGGAPFTLDASGVKRCTERVR